MLAPLNQRENEDDDKILSERDQDDVENDHVDGEVINTKDQHEKMNQSMTDD